MRLSKLGQVRLSVKVWDGESISETERKALTRALWKKYWDNEMDSFRDRIVLTSFILFPESTEERKNYIKENRSMAERLRTVFFKNNAL